MDSPAQKQPPEGRGRRAVGLVMLTFVLLVAVLLVVDAVQPSGYVLGLPLLSHPLAPWFTAASSVTLCWLAVRGLGGRSLGWRVTQGVGAGASLIALAAFLLGYGAAGRSIDSPTQHDLRLVVYQGYAAVDPVWTVSVRRSIAPGLDREFQLACLNGDAPGNSLDDVVWEAPDRVRVTSTGGRSESVRISADSGRPSRVVRFGANCD